MSYALIKILEYVPNANMLWNLVKENLKNINEIKFIELVDTIPFIMKKKILIFKLFYFIKN
jgi:hypothetical protein